MEKVDFSQILSKIQLIKIVIRLRSWLNSNRSIRNNIIEWIHIKSFQKPEKKNAG